MTDPKAWSVGLVFIEPSNGPTQQSYGSSVPRNRPHWRMYYPADPKSLEPTDKANCLPYNQYLFEEQDKKTYNGHKPPANSDC